MIDLDFSQVTPNFIRPRILTGPQIPKPAHGINPRTFMGKTWWDRTRKAAYQKNNLCCWACGILCNEDPYQPRLQAHECYDIDMRRGILTLREVVALCYSCHNFIHSGRLTILVVTNQVSEEEGADIMETRMALLKEHNLQPYWATEAAYLMLVEGKGESIALAEVWRRRGLKDVRSPPRHKWKLRVGRVTFDYKGKVIRGRLPKCC